MDELIYFGDAVKALDESGRVGGYLVRFSDANRKDLAGDYFTKDTYFGARDGDGCDTLFHHGIPVKKGLEDLADHVFAPIKTTKDDIGIFAETVLNQSDKYEAKVLELVNAGKLGWSSGSSSHLVKREKDGRLKRWIISEGSLTHMPCDPMNRAIPIKSLEVESEEFNVKGIFEEQLAENTPGVWQLQSAFEMAMRKLATVAAGSSITGVAVDVPAKVVEAVSEYAQRLAPLVTNQIQDFIDSGSSDNFYLKTLLDEFIASSDALVSDAELEEHSARVVSAALEFAQKSTALCSGFDAWIKRSRDKQEFRVKSGRTISAATKEKMSTAHGSMQDAVTQLQKACEHLQELMSMSEPKKDVDPDILRGLLATFEMQRRTITAGR